MMKQRRFKLTIALKIVDREENENFTADNTTSEEINLVTADDETNEITKEKKRANEEVFCIIFKQTLIKIFRIRYSRFVI